MGKLLVVDDVAANRMLLKKTLAAISNHEIIEAENGKDAIVQFEKESPDLILMDINMPEMDGYQSATAIKKLAGENHTPIIFVTALSAKDSLSDALASGGDDFINKPFDIEVLESKINAHLRIRELNQQLNVNNKQLSQLNNRLVYEQEIIEHFFEKAIQQSFLDKNIINYHMSSLSTFNGDIFLVERGPHGGMYLVMGDFTGHGLTAAMGTLPVALIFFKMAKNGDSVEDIACELNRQLHSLMPIGMFFAATILEINARGNLMSIWMGGMPECYWLGKEGELKGSIHAKHMPLGVLSDEEFDGQVEIVTVNLGDKIYLYSDGVVEAESPEGVMFGNDRLREILTSQNEGRFEQVLGALGAFTGTEDQIDDITFVEITCSNIPEDASKKESIVDIKSMLPWRFSMSLSAKDMRERDPVTELSDLLGSLPALTSHKGVLHIVLSEMYSNALDHSILELGSVVKTNEGNFMDYYHERDKCLRELDKASISFEFHFFSDLEQAYLRLQISDSGKGYKEQFSPVSDKLPYGRGLEIINSFCENVSFSRDGKTLDVTYRL